MASPRAYIVLVMFACLLLMRSAAVAADIEETSQQRAVGTSSRTGGPDTDENQAEESTLDVAPTDDDETGHSEIDDDVTEMLEQEMIVLGHWERYVIFHPQSLVDYIC